VTVTDFTLSTTFDHMTDYLIWQDAPPSQRLDAPDAPFDGFLTTSPG
jgi:hypothetical protein